MKKIMHIIPSFSGGGVEMLLLNYYMHMDHNKIKFNFIVYGETVGKLEEDFLKMGSRVYHISPRREAPFRSLCQMYKIILKESPDIVHAHQNELSFIPLMLAYLVGIKTRIAHSHTWKHPSRKGVHKIVTFLNVKSATLYFACTEAAGIWAFGEKYVKSEKFHIINNAIEVNRFKKNLEIRKTYRTMLQLGQSVVIGNVGRLSYEKNSLYLIEIYNAFQKKIPDSVLIIVGEGAIEGKIRKEVTRLQLEQKVKLLGFREDTNNLLQTFDVFLFPTKFEGFGIALLEAQIAQIPCFVSKDVFPEEVYVSNGIDEISLSKQADEWADEIVSNFKKLKEGYLLDNEKLTDYDIKIQAEKLEGFYEKCI